MATKSLLILLFQGVPSKGSSELAAAVQGEFAGNFSPVMPDELVDILHEI
jgi:hypothetical protein